MFWQSEFPTSHIDVLLQMPTVKLSDILFEEDLLQELKICNNILITFLSKPEVICELIENMTQLTEKDCCDKRVHSKVHAAYISCEILTSGSTEILNALMNQPESLSKIITCLTDQHEDEPAKVIPQKATLVGKLISTIHSMATANLSCHITQDIESFSKLINLLVNNIDVSGSFEILSTFIKRTDPDELRYVFCEVLSKLNYIQSLIDVMTISEIEDKQRNACQLLCDIIVIGHGNETPDSGKIAQDMLVELLESAQAARVILDQMFSNDTKNLTAIVCGIKVFQTLLKAKPTGVDYPARQLDEQTLEEIEKNLSKFHHLLLNPPKQEPIKTTFGVIRKPLGYIRLEIVNLIKELIGTNSHKIIRKLVELKTMKTIIDLFMEYSWNNLLHTQVEQALSFIIMNYRCEEEIGDIGQHNNHLEQQEEQEEKTDESKVVEIPSKALLSQLLNESDLIVRLLDPSFRGDGLDLNGDDQHKLRRRGEQANFGHIIKMINSLAINSDLDAIRDHLNEMKDKRPESYDRWTTCVNRDVVSFKEISWFFDAQLAIDEQSANQRFGHGQNHNSNNQNNSITSDSPSDNTNDEQLWAYFSFMRETVTPAINVDVLPRIQRSKNNMLG